MKKKLLYLLGLLFLLSCHVAHATQYVNSVQQLSVTIASGSLTGTVSGGTPTGTYVLFYSGCNTTAAASNGQAYARLAVDQGTGVVTATRGVSSTTTVTCTFSLMDATPNLVTSVQQNVITLSTTQGTGVTSTISSVTTADSSVFYEGMSQTLTTQHFDLNTYGVSLTNSTTVTGFAVSSGSGTTIGGYQVVNWNHAALNSSTQQYVTSWTNSSGSSTTQAVSPAVDPNNSMVAFGGGGGVSGDTNVREQPTIRLTSGSVITITIGDVADGNAQKEYETVVEFATGVLQQSAQRPVTAITASMSATSTITASATTSSALNWNGFLSSTTTNTTHATLLPSIALASSTSVTATLASSGSATSAAEILQFQNTGATPTYNSLPETFLSGPF